MNGAANADRHEFASEKIVIDGKMFYLDLQQNHRGRFLKITEISGERRESLMIPVAGFPRFGAALMAMLEVERRLGEFRRITERRVEGRTD
jgi:hypothetical protein